MLECVSKDNIRICCECNKEITYMKSDGRLVWYNHKCDKENCTMYICQRCYSSVYSHLPDSHNNKIKSISNTKTGNIGVCTNTGKGLIGEAVIAKIRKLEILAIKMDNFDYKYDLSADTEYGIIQVKFREPSYGDWNVSFRIVHNFDTLLVLCSSKGMKNIDRTYAIPEFELHGKQSIKITRNPSKGIQWYENYRIDEKPYNDGYQNLRLHLAEKTVFGIEEIRKWLQIPRQ